jgi:type I restriction enzyme R subunit
MPPHSEAETRTELIDRALRRVGWGKSYIKEEVNSVKSDFKRKNYVLRGPVIERGVDKFIDYLLLDTQNLPIAVIEAKNFSESEEKGRIQARSYVKDIQKQLGYSIPFFLTNGNVWKLVDEDGIERKVSGPFSQDDLSRRGELFKNRKDPKTVKIDKHIVDRPRSLENVRKLSEHFSLKHRKALVQMATGTGKTRVAMAVIKLLIDANTIRNVLFLADRISLVNQARSNGFKKFLCQEPDVDLRKGFSISGRLYVSTIQTMMGGKSKMFYEKFSPGFFDLIVFDEAHRSIYDKNNLLNGYFDAIKIGLTATPREHETKNTYDLFECEGNKPTVEYSYENAVLDGVLVPYIGEIVETSILSLGIRGAELTRSLQDKLRKQEENPETIELTGSQFDKVFMDDKTNELIIREFMERCYKSDEGLPCKSIFFCASQRHAKHLKRIFGKLFPHLGNDVQVITSDMARAEDEVVRFQLQSEPRIALSVGMLDTGIDVPEVCNLVFVKPIFSHIRFWQMVGRGTRNRASCDHPGWLPNGDKKDFLIMDFKIGDHSNLKYHNFEIAKERSKQKSILSRIFENRVKLLEKTLDKEQKALIVKKIMEDINSLDQDSFIVREKLSTIRKIREDSFDLEKYIDELNEDISPLMMIKESEGANISSFILRVEKLFGYILDEKFDKIDKTREFVQEQVENILQKSNLTEIKKNKTTLIKVLQEDFWDELSFDDVELMVRDIAPLMRYYEQNPRKILQIDAPDLVLSREKFEKEVVEDDELKVFLEKSPLIKKIKKGQGVTSEELSLLEAQLSELRPELTIDNVQTYQKKDFIQFIRDIIGLSNEYDPKELIKREFDDYIIKNNDYNSKQLAFLQLLKGVFAERKHIELMDLGKHPFSEEHPLDYFQVDELKEVINKCKHIKMY